MSDVNGWTAAQIKEFISAISAERDKRLDDRFSAQEQAIKKAEDSLRDVLRGFPQEYTRKTEIKTVVEEISAIRADHVTRMEFAALKELQADYVSIDKWESMNKAESTARAAALLRVDEKFEDYVKRYEVRQREIDLLLSAQKGAAEHAIRAAEDQGRKSNRNIGVAGVVLGLLVLFVNIIPQVIK